MECSYFSIFLTSQEEAKEGLNSHNEHVIDYTRAQICFAFISVLLMTMTIIAAFYTFKNSRYVYKRLASCLYFMTSELVTFTLCTAIYENKQDATDESMIGTLIFHTLNKMSTAITVLVVLEVLVTSVSYAASDKAQLYPTGAVVVYGEQKYNWQYFCPQSVKLNQRNFLFWNVWKGFSFYMGWSVFLVYLVNGCMFLILSRKRKLDKDLEEDADALDGGLIARR